MDKELTVKDIKEQCILPITHIFCRENNETHKYEIYIMNKSMTKLRTLEQYKNKDNSAEIDIALCSREYYGKSCRLKDGEILRSIAYYNNWLKNAEKLNTFDLTFYSYPDNTKYTTLKDLEKWANERQNDMDKTFENEREYSEEYVLKEKEVRDLLDF